MTTRDDQDDTLQHLLDALRAESGRPIKKGGLRRMFGTARAAARTGGSVLSGRLRGRGADGLSAANLKAIEQLVKSLGRLKGVPMKMGQILSYIDVTLPSEMRELLGLLQTQSQPSSFDSVTSTIREELGNRSQALIDHLDHHPVSSASIGQVHRGRLPDGRDVAVKVLHPGIEEAIRADFSVAQIGPVFARLIVPSGGASVKSFIEEAETRFREECDYLLEAERQQTFGDIFRDHETIDVPAVLSDWCSRSVLTSSWETGLDFERFVASDPSQETRNQIGAALFEFYVGTLYREGLFHADPHPGNLGFRNESRCDNRVVIYDYGCVRQFESDTVAGLKALSRAARDDDRDAMAEALIQIGAQLPKKERVLVQMRQLVRGFFGPMLVSGPTVVAADATLEAREVFRSKRALMRLRLPGKLLFLFRIRFGLYAVLSRLGAVCDWRALESEATDAS